MSSYFLTTVFSLSLYFFTHFFSLLHMHSYLDFHSSLKICAALESLQCKQYYIAVWNEKRPQTRCGTCVPGLTSYTDTSTHMHLLLSNPTSSSGIDRQGDVWWDMFVMTTCLSHGNTLERLWWSWVVNIPPRGHKDYRKYLQLLMENMLQTC